MTTNQQNQIRGNVAAGRMTAAAAAAAMFPKTEATARPWKALCQTDKPSGLRDPQGNTYAGVRRWRVVADLGPNYPPEMGMELPMYNGEGEANAALIVRAVNAHDGLVAALEAIDSLVERYSPDDPATLFQYKGHVEPLLYKIQNQARDALAKARST